MTQYPRSFRSVAVTRVTAPANRSMPTLIHTSELDSLRVTVGKPYDNRGGDQRTIVAFLTMRTRYGIAPRTTLVGPVLSSQTFMKPSATMQAAPPC